MFAVPPNTILLPADPAAAHPVRIAREYATDPDRWRRELRYRADQRFVRLLERTPDHEVWLMSWLPGQCTEPHDHGGPCLVAGAHERRGLLGRAGPSHEPRHDPVDGVTSSGLDDRAGGGEGLQQRHQKTSTPSPARGWAPCLTRGRSPHRRGVG